MMMLMLPHVYFLNPKDTFFPDCKIGVPVAVALAALLNVDVPLVCRDGVPIPLSIPVIVVVVVLVVVRVSCVSEPDGVDVEEIPEVRLSDLSCLFFFFFKSFCGAGALKSGFIVAPTTTKGVLVAAVVF